MKNCRYCSILPNGDIPMSSIDIVDKSITRNTFDLCLGNNGRAGFAILITDKNCNFIKSIKLKFKFCPMCGKKLNDIEGRTIEEEGE